MYSKTSVYTPTTLGPGEVGQIGEVSGVDLSIIQICGCGTLGLDRKAGFVSVANLQRFEIGRFHYNTIFFCLVTNMQGIQYIEEWLGTIIIKY